MTDKTIAEILEAAMNAGEKTVTIRTSALALMIENARKDVKVEAAQAKLLDAALDMRAALANLDEGNDDPDASAAKDKFDDAVDDLTEAGVTVVIAPGDREGEG